MTFTMATFEGNIQYTTFGCVTFGSTAPQMPHNEYSADTMVLVPSVWTSSAPLVFSSLASVSSHLPEMCYLVNLRRHIDRMCESECKCVSVYVRDLRPPHIVFLSFAQCMLG